MHNVVASKERSRSGWQILFHSQKQLLHGFSIQAHQRANRIYKRLWKQGTGDWRSGQSRDGKRKKWPSKYNFKRGGLASSIGRDGPTNKETERLIPFGQPYLFCL